MPTFPMFPLGTALLPGEVLPLNIFEPRYRALVEHVLEAPDGPLFGVVLIARGHEVGGGESRHDTGTLARVESHVAMGGGRYQLFCRTEDRIRVRQWLPDDPYPQAEVELWPDENNGTPVTAYEYESLLERIDFLFGLLRKLATRAGKPVPRVPTPPPVLDPLGSRLYALARGIPMGDADRLAILTAPGADERIRTLSEAVENAVELAQFNLL
ncbi:Lon protease-like protein [Rhodococcus sp. 27YEA15]|uniref:LON peptidase substrate-binding domain-containing protein n=1 Tax=Rhodococcus sp. 27YEA15 TaxID=3156259 RepID=UPI003C7E2252